MHSLTTVKKQILKSCSCGQSLRVGMHWCCTPRAAASALAAYILGQLKTCINTRRVSACLSLWAQPRGTAYSPGLSSVQTQSHGIRGPTDVNTAGSECVCVLLQCNPGKVWVQFPFLAAWLYLRSWTCAFNSLAFTSCLWNKASKPLLWFRH